VFEPETDRELLEAAWRSYAGAFGDHVGDVVTPYEYVDTEEQASWAARVFMFGYGLGSLAGAGAAAPDRFDQETDAERVDALVDAVVDISGSDEFEASTERVLADFLEE
jgi:hypothetical protein